MAKTPEPANTDEAGRFKALLGRLLRVSKEDLSKREAEYQQTRPERKPRPAGA